MPKALQQERSSVSIASFSSLIIKVSKHNANEVVSSVQVCGAVKVKVITIERRRCDQLIAKSFGWQDENRLEFRDVEVHKGDQKRDEYWAKQQ